MDVSKSPTLSICIAAFNRAGFIGSTLDSIVNQITPACEIVVLDGGSTDNTAEVVGQYAQRFPCLRYVRQEPHAGLDHAIDEVVQLARGDYCWLPTSKDLFKPGAVAAVLERIHADVSLIAVNMEIRDITLSTVLVDRSITFEEDVVYNPEEMDRLFREAFNVVSHLSCLVIRRTIWLSRERQRYYGSLCGHWAVVFQQPLPAKAVVISKPLICHRYGGQSWLRVATQQQLMWSFVINSLAISEPTKRAFNKAGPLERFNALLLNRAYGLYSWAEYRRFVLPETSTVRELLLPALAAFIPGSVLNAIFVLQNRVSADNYRDLRLHMLRASRFHMRNWRWVSRHC